MTDEEIIKEIENIRKFNYTLAPDEVFDRAISAIKESKGEWIEESDNHGHSSYFCSRCGTQEGKPSDICPNCRARMSNSENPNKCGDLISRQAVLKLIEHLDVDFANSFDPHTLTEIYRCVKEMPSVENECGTWRHYEGMLYCSKCGAEFYDEIMEYTGDEVPKHCPDCGADMRGE